MQAEKTMLQAEIEFWRFMIESRRGMVSDEATERMKFACELAERRLLNAGNQSVDKPDQQQWS